MIPQTNLWRRLPARAEPRQPVSRNSRQCRAGIRLQPAVRRNRPQQFRDQTVRFRLLQPTRRGRTPAGRAPAGEDHQRSSSHRNCRAELCTEHVRCDAL